MGLNLSFFKGLCREFYLLVHVGEMATFELAGLVDFVDRLELRLLLDHFAIGLLAGPSDAFLVFVFLALFFFFVVLVTFGLQLVVIKIHAEDVLSFLKGSTTKES